MMTYFLVDEGILLTEKDEEFESYAIVYDKKYGYYDENQYYTKIKQKAIKDARRYVEAGVENTYAIVSKSMKSSNFDLETSCIENETYNVEDVIYSVAKINGKIVENFLIS